MSIREMLKELRVFYKYLKPYNVPSLYVILSMTIVAILQLARPIIDKMLIDEVFINRNIKMLLVLVVALVLLFILTEFFIFARQYLQVYVGSLMTIKMRSKVFGKTINTKEAENISSGELLLTLDGDVFVIQNTILNNLLEFVVMIGNFIIISAIMIYFSWEYYFVIFFTIPLAVFNNKLFSKKMIDKNATYKSGLASMFSFVGEVFNNTKSIKILSKQKYFERKFININKTVVKSLFDFGIYSWITGISKNFIKFIDTLITLVIGGYMVYTGKITIGTYIAMSSYKIMLQEVLFKLLNFKIDMSGLIVSMSRFNNAINMRQEESGKEKDFKVSGNFEFKDITFGYEKEKIIFDAFNLKIRKGEKIAFVGESGCGKSTIVNLIMGLHIPQKGEIIVDGKNIDDLKFGEYRKRIGVVSQESFFFNKTIRENLLLGERVSDEEILKVCRGCQIDDLLVENGINKTLDINGKNISGGQKQRLALARVLLRKTDVIILDEATSALDNITEMNIFEFLKEELREKTVISIAHRLSTIKDFDRIMVMDEGKIVEEGNHESLLRKEGYYFNLINRKETALNTNGVTA